MAIYIVIPTGPPLDTEVMDRFDEGNRYKFPSGVWFVRSDHLTSSDVIADLGIKVGGKSGVVVAPARYNGVAERDFIEKLQVWESM